MAAPVVLMLVLLSAACGDPEAAKQEYLRSGDRLYAEARYSEAIVQYRNAIQIDNRFGQARYQLAKAYAQLDNGQNAREQLIRAADLLPDDAEVQLAAAQMLLQAGEFQDARARAERALLIDPSSADAHIVRGRASAGMRDFEDALATFEEGLGLNPDRSDLYVNLGLLRRAQGDPEKAEASFRQAIVVAPKLVSARLALADFYWSGGRTADAEAALGDALEIDPNHRLANRGLAMLYLTTGRPERAEAPLRRVAESTQDPQSQLVLADYYLTVRRYADAAPILDALSQRAETRIEAATRRAAVENYLGRRANAYAILEEVLSAQPRNAEALVSKGRLLLADRNFTEALTVAQSAVEANAQSAEAHALHGAVHAALIRLDEADSAFNEALRLSPGSLDALIGLAELNVVRRRYDAGVQLAEEAVRAGPGSAAARLILARALTARGDLPRARTALQPLLDQAADVAAVQSLLGQIELKAGNRAAARAAFDRALTIEPASVDAHAGLVSLDAATSPARAVARAEALLETAPRTPATLSLAARTHLAAGDYPRAETLVLEALGLDAGYRPAYDLLSTAYLRQNKVAQAQQMFETLVEQRPNDVPAHTMLGILFELQQKRDQAKRAYERALALDPRAALASNNLAYIHAEEGQNLDVALNLAQAAKAVLPDDPIVSDTLGWVYYKRNLPAQAIQYLRESAQTDPSNPIYHYHLGMALLQAGQAKAARTSLEQALELNADFDGAPEARKALASITG
jgi:tetratricopeptide (TPR) repeat protein